jgi:hypothetical protein
MQVSQQAGFSMKAGSHSPPVFRVKGFAGRGRGITRRLKHLLKDQRCRNENSVVRIGCCEHHRAHLLRWGVARPRYLRWQRLQSAGIFRRLRRLGRTCSMREHGCHSPSTKRALFQVRIRPNIAGYRLEIFNPRAYIYRIRAVAGFCSQ